jgi:hypothetical protein
VSEREDFKAALRDLSWLAENGALNGVAAILRARREHIGRGRTAGHDDLLCGNAELLAEASDEMHCALGVLEEAPGHVARAGALLAAEHDRIERERLST